MRKIIQILIKNHVFFLFIFLECISFQFLIANNFLIESSFIKKATNIRSFFFLKEKEIKEYFFLKTINEELLFENAKLLKENLILNHQINNNNLKLANPNSDSIIQAKVLKNTWNKRHNFITINKGKVHGVLPNMGVISQNNLIGITQNISDHFSVIISVLNCNLGITAKIKNSGQGGILSWNGKDYREVQLNDIPKHASIKIGDTITTSGWGNILPPDINIGIVSDYKTEKNSNFLYISVDLFADFTNLEYIYLVENLFQSEREEIEKTIEN